MFISSVGGYLDAIGCQGNLGIPLGWYHLCQKIVQLRLKRQRGNWTIFSFFSKDLFKKRQYSYARLNSRNAKNWIIISMEANTLAEFTWSYLICKVHIHFLSIALLVCSFSLRQIFELTFSLLSPTWVTAEIFLSSLPLPPIPPSPQKHFNGTGFVLKVWYFEHISVNIWQKKSCLTTRHIMLLFLFFFKQKEIKRCLHVFLLTAKNRQVQKMILKLPCYSTGSGSHLTSVLAFLSRSRGASWISVHQKLQLRINSWICSAKLALKLVSSEDALQ